MRTPKLFKVLASLPKEDLSKFQNFLLLSVSKKTDEYQFLNHFIKFFFSNESDKKVSTFKDIFFPQTSHKSFLNLNSRLFAKFLKWGAYYEFSNSLYEEEILLSKFLNRRGLYEIAESQGKKLKTKIESDGLSLEGERAKTQIAYYSYYSDNPKKYDFNDDHLKNLFQLSCTEYKNKILLIMTELANWGKMNKIDYTKELNEGKRILQIKYESNLTSIIEILYQQSIQTNLANHKILKKPLLNNAFPIKSDLHNITSFYLFKHVRNLWFSGQTKSLDAVHEIVEYCMRSGVLMTNNRITTIRFFNLISILGLSTSFEKCKEFIDNWAKHVQCKSTNEILNLSYGILFLSHERYEEMIDQIYHINLSDIDSKLRWYTLVLIGLFEQKWEPILFHSHHEKFVRFLRRNKSNISKSVHEQHSNFGKIIFKIFGNKHKPIDIHIENFTPLVNLHWVRKKIKSRQ